jgi:protein-S-isoprenylcysteine O-methyltransferase Ste14
MLPDFVIASFLALSLASAFGRGVYESKKSRGQARSTHEEAKPASHEPLLVLGAVFALVFYGEMILYVILVFGLQTVLTTSFLQLHFPLDSLIQGLGILMIVLGYILVFWGLSALEYDKLTTWGPYQYVRHPQYLGYFIIFAGFFLTLLNLIALLPLLATPGEIRQAKLEEEFLTREFGNAYIRYQQETGKFFPKMKSWEQNQKQISR